MSGPYNTRGEALADADALTEAVRAADPGFGSMTDEIRAARRQARVDYLARALADAGVQLGEYDRRIAVWLADWETETLQVVVGWIERAHAAGNLAATAHHADASVEADRTDALTGAEALVASVQPGDTMLDGAL